MLHTTYALFHFLLVAVPCDATWLQLLLIWATRIATLALVLRDFVGPFVLATASRQLRVRSISLRSIRGVYLSYGSCIWRIDRITYAYARSRFTLKLDRVSVQIRLQPPSGHSQSTAFTSPTATAVSHLIRFLSASLSILLTPLISLIRAVVLTLWAILDPFLRPPFRYMAVGAVSRAIAYLPKVSDAFSVEVSGFVMTFPDLPGMSVEIGNAQIQASLKFSDEELLGRENETARRRLDSSSSSHLRSLRRKVNKGFKKAWRSASSHLRGAASLSLSFSEVTARASPESQPFFGLPDTAAFAASLKFIGYHHIEPESIIFDLQIGSCHLNLDQLLMVWKRGRSTSIDKKAPTLRPRASLTISLPSAKKPTHSRELSSFFWSPANSAAAHEHGPADASPKSAYSPFLGTLSASVLRSPFRALRPVQRLKRPPATPPLWWLKHIDCSVSSFQVVTTTTTTTEKFTLSLMLQSISLLASPSNPSDHFIHRQSIGCHPKDPCLDGDSALVGIGVNKIALERITKRGHSTMVSLGTSEVSVLVSEWPYPLMGGSIFIEGCPNKALVKGSVNLGQLELRVDEPDIAMLSQLATSLKKPKDGRPLDTSPPLASANMPRIQFDLSCGTIYGSFISQDAVGIHVSSDGFNLSCVTQYEVEDFAHSNAIASSQAEAFRFKTSMEFFCHTWKACLVDSYASSHPYTFSSGNSAICDDDDSVLCMLGPIQSTISATARALLWADARNVASVDLTSLLWDIGVRIAEFKLPCVRPFAVHALSSIVQRSTLSTPSRHEEEATSQTEKNLSHWGGQCQVSLGQFDVVFLASDINPEAKPDGLIGMHISITPLSYHYAALRLDHVGQIRGLAHRSETRHKLYLEEERLVHAYSAAKAAVHSKQQASYSRLNFFSFVAGPAVRLEGSLPTRTSTDATLKLRTASFDMVVSRNMDDACSFKRTVLVQLPEADILVTPWHVYALIMVTQLFHRPLSPEKAIPSSPSPKGQASRYVEVKAAELRLHLKLPKEQVRVVFSSSFMASDLAGAVQFRFAKARGSVVVPTTMRWQDGNGHTDEGLQWRELFIVRALNVIHFHSRPLEVTGEAARLQVPSGYVLSNLIRELSVIVKTTRHLRSRARDGRYTPFPSPRAEGPKSVPNMHISFRVLILELADDPFESHLNLIWRASLGGAKSRVERDNAFQAKVAAVLGTVPGQVHLSSANYHFGAQHTISIEDALRRLGQVHSLDHCQRVKELHQRQAIKNAELDREIYGEPSKSTPPSPHNPPLLRILLRGLDVQVGPPSFPLDHLPDFLSHHGRGLPRDTPFWLLVPFHLSLRLSSLSLTVRDYPSPLLDVPPKSRASAALHFDTDLVIAEEMGTEASVDWAPCPIIDQYSQYPELRIMVPKTMNPVKSYAAPTVNFLTEDLVRCGWSISYSPAIQDVTRIFDTLTSTPRDASTPLGFWDKLRLVFHWKFHVHFKGPVQFQMKSTRDPYNTTSSGAGFALRWAGHPKLLIGQENDDRELIQVISDTMLVVIPSDSPNPDSPSGTHRKVCAKFSSGVRFGVGFALERACGEECLTCRGPPTQRKCRFFHFKPHYDVTLTKKTHPPIEKSENDSYNTFRSDFIHLSLSLTSAVRPLKHRGTPSPSSLHLTSQVFRHFWAWWSLFDGVLALPIRRGSYFPARRLSPKVGRHISTIKYRISVPDLFLMHAYIDDSLDTWADGVTPWVGVKARIALFQVDMHQRAQQCVLHRPFLAAPKVIGRKRFYAAELVMKDLDLRVLVATFPDKIKQSIDRAGVADADRQTYRSRSSLPRVSVPSSLWYDRDDFIELNWSSDQLPSLHLLPVASCPRFTYFKKNLADYVVEGESSKFGKEDTHHCLLGIGPVPRQIQTEMLQARLRDLQSSVASSAPNEQKVLLHTIAKLQQYISEEEENLARSSSPPLSRASIVTVGDEWSGFDHVYQVHFPRLFVDPAVRDILVQYYHCSTAVRGLDYHVATRAVKYILDQAEAQVSGFMNSTKFTEGQGGAFSKAGLFKMFTGDTDKLPGDGVTDCPDTILSEEALQGWQEGVSRTRVHCCYLLNPQLVLRSDHSMKDCSVIAATQARLTADGYMDDLNADDPINGKVMSRIQIKLSDLQLFAPTSDTSMGDGVPPEILVDPRFETTHFVRLVPQTDAEFVYDKFNRLRLRNKHVLASDADPHDQSISNVHTNHLRDQTDLIQVNIPRFTVTADDRHFQVISDLVSKLVLFTNARHKSHLDRLETLLFTYDFTDLSSLVQVVVDIQGRLRMALETAKIAQESSLLATEQGSKEFNDLRAHILTLSEELNLLFEAIKLAQDRSTSVDGVASSLLLKAWSSELSWRMLDERKELLAKLVCKGTRFCWLSRPDSSTVNDLRVGILLAFDGSPNATWTEILSKQEEHSSPRRPFAHADWIVLPPVGGILIYEYFKLELHPLRLQVDAKVGVRMMEYFWPSRKARRHAQIKIQSAVDDSELVPTLGLRSSLDSPRRTDFSTLPPPNLRRIPASRSFTDLRGRSEALNTPPPITRSGADGFPSSSKVKWRSDLSTRNLPMRRVGDASEMKTRSSQKSFVLVQISSLDLVLSIQKDDSFVCRDAHIRTRPLEYRNQTWSFEELVNQFIPADMSWKGWLKMAFHQPLVPVFPVARELISKTKLLSTPKQRLEASKMLLTPPSSSPSSRSQTPNQEIEDVKDGGKRSRGWRRIRRREPSGSQDDAQPSIPSSSSHSPSRSNSGKRILGFFHRSNSSNSHSSPSMSSSTNDLDVTQISTPPKVLVQEVLTRSESPQPQSEFS